MNKMAEKYTLEVDETEPKMEIHLNYQPLIQCSRIICYNKSAGMTKWAIDSETSRLSISPSLNSNETWTFDLSTMKIPDGTQIILKSLAENNRTSTIILEYYSHSNIAVSFRLERTKSNPLLVFLGTSSYKFKRI